MTKEIFKENPVADSQTTKENERELILMNDDVHTFEYVIDALQEVCDHTVEQATQCTFLVHYKGQCEVKKGPFNHLRPMRRALAEKELRAIIN